MYVEGSKRIRPPIDFRFGAGADNDPRHYAYCFTGEALDGLQALPATKPGRALIELLAEHQKHHPEFARAQQLTARVAEIAKHVATLPERHRSAIDYVVQIVDSCRTAIESEDAGKRDNAWRAVLLACDYANQLGSIARATREKRHTANSRYSDDEKQNRRWSICEQWYEKRRGTPPEVATDAAFVAEVCRAHPDLNHDTVVKWVQRWNKGVDYIFEPWPLFSKDHADAE